MKKIVLTAAFLAVGAAAEEPELSLESVVFPQPLSYVVTSSVADLRREPREVDGAAALKRPYDMDPLQETQLLYGEKIMVFERRGGWLRVRAVEQVEFSHDDAWEGYPGWLLKKDAAPLEESYEPNAVVSVRFARLHDAPDAKTPFQDVPLGARLQVLFEALPWVRVKRPGRADGWIKAKDLRRPGPMPPAEEELRGEVLRSAALFLKEPYHWGGRAGHRPDWSDRPTGVDCSGLVNLAYRANGVDLPRDAHEQFMRSFPISDPAQLKPADLIFLADEKSPNKITHVMLYAGSDRAIEAVHEFDVVRRVTLREKLGQPLRALSPLRPAGGRYVYFGRPLAGTESK